MFKYNVIITIAFDGKMTYISYYTLFHINSGNKEIIQTQVLERLDQLNLTKFDTSDFLKIEVFSPDRYLLTDNVYKNNISDERNNFDFEHIVSSKIDPASLKKYLTLDDDLKENIQYHTFKTGLKKMTNNSISNLFPIRKVTRKFMNKLNDFLRNKPLCKNVGFKIIFWEKENPPIISQYKSKEISDKIERHNDKVKKEMAKEKSGQNENEMKQIIRDDDEADCLSSTDKSEEIHYNIKTIEKVNVTAEIKEDDKHEPIHMSATLVEEFTNFDIGAREFTLDDGSFAVLNQIIDNYKNDVKVMSMLLSEADKYEPRDGQHMIFERIDALVKEVLNFRSSDLNGVKPNLVIRALQVENTKLRKRANVNMEFLMNDHESLLTEIDRLRREVELLQKVNKLGDEITVFSDMEVALTIIKGWVSRDDLSNTVIISEIKSILSKFKNQ